MAIFLVCIVLVLIAPIVGAMADEEPELMDQPIGFIHHKLLPFLRENEQATLLFGAELNISNGDPFTRDYGERGMFGRLESAHNIMKDLDDVFIMYETVEQEVERLLLGPWTNNGSTRFEYVTRYNVKCLDYETGKWIKRKKVECVRIIHITEYTNQQRSAYISIEEDTLFSIVRKQ